MSAEYSGLQGSNIAMGRATTTSDPAAVTLNAHFGIGTPLRLGTGRFSVKLTQPCAFARRVVATSSNDGHFANEDMSAPVGDTVVFQIVDAAGQPVDGVCQFIIGRTTDS